MAQNQKPKLWHPARFTHGSVRGSGDENVGPNQSGQHTVIILNNPLDNKELFVGVCLEGMPHSKAKSL